METAEHDKFVEDVNNAYREFVSRLENTGSFVNVTIPIEALPYLREIWRAQDVAAGEEAVHPAGCQFEYPYGVKCLQDGTSVIHNENERNRSIFAHPFKVI